MYFEEKTHVPELEYPIPFVVPLEEQFSNPADADFHLPYEGLLCQDEYRSIEMPILPTQEEVKKLLEERGLTQADRDYYLSTIRRLFEESRIPLEIGPGCSLEQLLMFCSASMWHLTGDHNEELTNQSLKRSKQISASELIDIDHPPATKCSFFNSAFVYLFEAACTFFKREDLLKRYQMIGVKNIPTHLYLGLVSRRESKVRISAIDPYHTGLRDDIEKNSVLPQELLNKLDQTPQRGDALQQAYNKSINWE